MLKWFLTIAVLLWSLTLSTQAGAQLPVRINWTAVTGAQSGMFMAQQEGLFKKNGLDVELLHISSSSRGIQAILAGEIAFSYMDGSNLVQANLKGANLAFVAGATNRQVFSLMAKPEIKRITELRGKKIGITRIGSSTHTSALLLEYRGFEAERLSDPAVGGGAQYSHRIDSRTGRRRRGFAADQ